jgi:EAL domain-containing protein (putative c-di-GMP-specific phosphodiesterase class I)
VRIDDLLNCIFVAREAVTDVAEEGKLLRDAGEEREFCMAEILDALNNGEFKLYYQPRLNLAEGLIAGMEAFIYCPRQGIINMDKLVAEAENTDFLLPLRAWLFNEICRQAAFWQAENAIFAKISANVFSLRPDPAKFSVTLRTALEKYKLDPKYFDLEISEKAVARENNKTLASLNEALGISLAASLDSSASDYVSVLKLCNAPVAAIKINDSFISGLPYNESDNVFVRLVLDAAANSDVKTIAVGLNNKDQLEFLLNRGCDLVQGDFICPPLPAHLLEKFFDVYISECKKSGIEYNVLIGGANSPVAPELIIERLEKELAREKLINTLYEMVISAKDIAGTINNALKMLGQYLGVSQAYILEVSADEKFYGLTYNWIASAKEGGWEKQQSFLTEGFYNYYSLFHSGVLCVNDIAEIPEPFFSEYNSIGYTSFLQAVIILDGNIAGHIGFYNKKDPARTWGNKEIEVLKSAAVIFSFALSRARAEGEQGKDDEQLDTITEG